VPLSPTTIEEEKKVVHRLGVKPESPSDSMVGVLPRASETLIRLVRDRWSPYITAGITLSAMAFVVGFVVLYSKVRAAEIRLDAQASRINRIQNMVVANSDLREDLPIRIQSISEDLREMGRSLESIQGALQRGNLCPPTGSEPSP